MNHDAPEKDLDEVSPSADTAVETEPLDSEEVEDAASDVTGGRLHPRAWFYALTAVLVVFFGAGREPWSKSLALLAMGLVIVIAPPRFHLRSVPTITLLCLALAPVSGLLPAAWFGSLEDWRLRLINEWSVPLSSSVSPEFWTTLESWLVLVSAVVWFWSCLGQNFSDSGRKLVLRILSVFGLVLAVTSLLEFNALLPMPWWPRSRDTTMAVGLGPFANHNHASSFFAFCCVLSAAAAYDSFRHKSRWWIAHIVSLLLQLTCILVNTSRAGLMLFFVGMTLWLATAAMKRGLLRKMMVSMALVLSVGSLVLVAGGQLSERLKARPVTEMLSSDLRWQLAEESLSAVAKTPWTGRGLGLFEKTLPLVSSSPFPDARPLHPESDVLWLLFEGGLLLLIPTLVFVAWYASSTGPWVSRRKKQSHSSRSGRRVRKAFAIAVALMMTHAIFDVPLHGVGYFLVFSVVAAQGLRARRLGGLMGPLGVWGFRLAGILVAGFGLLGLASSTGLTDKGFASAARRLEKQAVEELDKGRRTESLALVQRAIELTPLDYRLHYLRAQLHLEMRSGHEKALFDFGCSRAIEPRFGPLCIEEGRYWLYFDPKLALIPWREALKRYPSGFLNVIPHYQSIVIYAEPYPEIMRPLWKIADSVPLQLVFLSRQTVKGELWDQCLKDFLDQHAGLQGLNRQQINFLFYNWRIKGSQPALVEYLKKNPRLQEFGWQVLSHDLAQSGQFEAAYRLAGKFLTMPARSASLTAADIPRLERAYLFNPVDALPGVELYYAQRASGDLKSARATLEKVMQLPTAPSFLKREMAAVLADSGDMRGAWELMQQLIESSPVQMSVMDLTPDEAGDNIQRPMAPPPRDGLGASYY